MEPEQSLTTLIEAAVTGRGGAREDALLQVRSFSDIETKLSAAPVALGILGAVAVVSASSPDFSLVNGENNKEFQQLQFPTSFRASLAQVGNNIYDALRIAHGNMGFIDITMIQIPGQMLDIVSLLRRGTSYEVKTQLPIELESMKEASERGKTKVKEVLERFDIVIATLQELVMATHDTKGLTEEGLKKANLQIKQAQIEEENFKAELARVEEELSKTAKKVEEEEREFKEELDRAGSWAEMSKQVLASATDTGLNVVVPTMAASGGMSMMASTFSNVESIAAVGMMGVTSAAKMYASGAASGGQGDSTAAGPRQITQEEKDIAKSMEILQKHGIDPLEYYFKPDHTLDMVKLKNDDRLMEAEYWADKQRKVVDKASKESKVPRDIKYGALDLIGNVKSFVNRMKEVGQSKRTADEGLYEDWRQLQTTCDEIGMIQSASYGAQIHQPPSPGFMDKAKSAIGGSNVSENMAKRMFANLEMRKEQLRSTEVRAEALRLRKMEQSKEMLQTLKELTTFEEEKMSKEQILEAIAKGLRALYQLREQWTQLFLYFKEIDNLMQAAMGPAMTKFVKMAEAEEARMDNQMTELSKERLFKTVTHVVVTSRVVLFLSKSYLSLSNDHLMPMMNSFGELLSLSSDDKVKMGQQQIQLRNRTQEAQRAIGEIIESGHREFKQDLAVRREALDRAYEEQPALQNVSSEVREEVRQRVQEGFRKAERRGAADYGGDEDFMQMADELDEATLIEIALEESLFSGQHHSSEEEKSIKSCLSQEVVSDQEDETLQYVLQQSLMDDQSQPVAPEVDETLQYALQQSLKEEEDECQSLVPTSNNETAAFTRSLSQEPASSLVLVHLTEAMASMTSDISHLPSILSSLHLALSELDHVFQGLNQHYEAWMFDLLLERKNLEEIQSMLRQEKVELEQIVEFVGRVIETKRAEIEADRVRLRECEGRVEAAREVVATTGKGRTTAVAVTSAIAVGLLFIPIPGSRILSGLLFGARAALGGLEIARSVQTGTSKIKDAQRIQGELEREQTAKEKHMVESKAGIEKNEEEKLMNEVKLAWKDWDLEQHFKREESQKEIQKKGRD